MKWRYKAKREAAYKKSLRKPRPRDVVNFEEIKEEKIKK